MRDRVPGCIGAGPASSTIRLKPATTPAVIRFWNSLRVDGILHMAYRLVAPSFAWAEVGTVLMKKVRVGLLTRDEADLRWRRFLSLAIDFIEGDEGDSGGEDGREKSLAQATWDMAARLGLPVMYDGAFLAAAEIVAKRSGGAVEFWTADRELVDELGDKAPPYVRLLPGLS